MTSWKAAYLYSSVYLALCYTVVSPLKIAQDLEVICGLVRYPASPLHYSRPEQGGVRVRIMHLGPTVSLTDNEWVTKKTK